jgi:transcriptional regulator with XRE-family HTH domain
MDLPVDEITRAAVSSPTTAEAPLDLGARLKALRKRKKWTLQQASDRTGVGVSTLSKVERNELSPTVTTLQRIAAGFEIDSATLLTGQDTPLRVAGRRSVTRAKEGRPFPTGTCNNAWLCPDLTQKIMVPIRTTVVARSIEDYPEWARYDAEVFIHVLKGTVVVHSQIYEPVRISAGDSMYYDASTPHLWVSEGEENAEVLWVYANY